MSGVDDDDLNEYFYEETLKYSDEPDSEAEVVYYNNEYYNVVNDDDESSEKEVGLNQCEIEENNDLEISESESIKSLNSEESEIYTIDDELYSDEKENLENGDCELELKNISQNAFKRRANEDSSSDEPKPSKKFKLDDSSLNSKDKLKTNCTNTKNQASPLLLQSTKSSSPSKGENYQESNIENGSIEKNSKSSSSPYYIESSDSDDNSKGLVHQKDFNKNSIKLNTSSQCTSDGDNTDISFASFKEANSASKDLMLKEILGGMPGAKHHWKLLAEDQNATSKARDRRFCLRCRERGHLSYNCPNPSRGPLCIYCGDEGHEKKYCPQPLCFKCFASGHRARHCLWSNDGVKCSHCLMYGHLKNECPDIWRRFYLTVSPGPIVPGPSTHAPKKAHCYNCGKSGHRGHVCQSKRFLSHAYASFPFIVSYDDPKEAQMYSTDDKLFKRKCQAIQKSNMFYAQCDPFIDSDSDVPSTSEVVIPSSKKKKKKKKKIPDCWDRRKLMNGLVSTGQKFAKGLKQKVARQKKVYEVDRKNDERGDNLRLSKRPQFMSPTPCGDPRDNCFPRNNPSAASRKKNAKLKRLKNKCKQRLKASPNN